MHTPIVTGRTLNPALAEQIRRGELTDPELAAIWRQLEQAFMDTLPTLAGFNRAVILFGLSISLLTAMAVVGVAALTGLAGVLCAAALALLVHSILRMQPCTRAKRLLDQFMSLVRQGYPALFSPDTAAPPGG